MERKVLICGGTGCTSSGSMKIADKLEEEIKKKGIDDHVKVVRTGCFGLCALGPIMIVYPEGTFYSMMSADHIERIVEEHLVNDRIVEEYVYEETKTPDGIIAYNQTNFYKKQHRVALRNCGVIDPENIDDYLEKDGYKALEKVVTEMTPEQVIDVISKSGLRGRGGGGFPTGRKWQMARTIVPVADQKYVCCNADEGDPGAFMD
ncbi:MAG TPA: NADH-quinone oxidoreductase subunit F, partial [Ruminococcaceae bacterium]|nr:NADH-quinone oxidoreductase subunit F [Oscillospiraceae bacterium]